jgi:hypothetical protein
MNVKISSALFCIVFFVLITDLSFTGCVSQPEADTKAGTNQEPPASPGELTPEQRASVEMELQVPEQAMLSFLEKLGYDRSYLLPDFQEEKYTGERNVWTVGIKDGFDDLCYGMLLDPGDTLLYVKFSVPPGDLSPETVRPGEDIVIRIANALGLYDEGYILPDWNKNPGMAELRKYADYGNYSICTNWVIIFTDPVNHSLLAIHFADSVLPANPLINTNRDSAIEAARTELGDPAVEIAHAELVNRSEMVYPPDEYGIFWEVAFENGNTISVNAADGRISRATPMY